MSIRVFLFALLCVVVSCGSVEVTAEQLAEIAHGETTDTWFIKFYGPNCGFCKGMSDEWIKFAALVDEEGYDIQIGEFNVHLPENQESAEVKSLFPGPLPGLHLFVPGDKKYYEFPNARLNIDAENYLNFALFDYEQSDGVYKKSEYLYEEESALVSIPGEEFDAFLETGKTYFVMFFGPKCGWCKHLMPLWTQFAEEALAKNADYTVARMDGFTNMKIITRYDARPWPSLIFIKEGKYYRMDTDIARDIKDTAEFFHWIESGEYLEADEEHSGEDKGFTRYLKLKEAKERSQAKKKEKDEL